MAEREQNAVDRIDEERKQVDACIARLWDGAGARSDFRDFVLTLEKWSARADEEGLRGVGEQGTLSRGVALAYREILGRIREAVDPPKEFAQGPQEQVG